MIAIDGTLISDNLHRIKFCCDLPRCFGACCVEGDAGAPLEPEELALIKESFALIKPFMQDEGIAKIEKEGLHEFDPAGNLVTPLIHGKECAFVFYLGDVAHCAIEKAYNEKLIPLRKPVSCHLYPVRIHKYQLSEAVNYHEWHVCHPGLIKGKIDDVPLYVFLKDALIRKYGQGWYRQLVKEIEKK